ncbi:Cacna1c [Symbiodinium pilosum]|uniref:Cacna1c protein n=1 Tax=Symbiodinium pilosum TaxID=2952 RepID=A0A812TCE1_SYMPI|nr:Cacna1c [Symbiodinium pilosum]
MNREAFAQLLDSSWFTFRQQLLQAYPEPTNGVHTPSEVRFDIDVKPSSDAEAVTYEPNILWSQRIEENSSPGIPEKKVSLAVEAPGEDPTKESVSGRRSMASLDSEEEDPSSAISHGDSRMCLTSGMKGLSNAEIRAIKHRLRVRLGKISSMKLVSGKNLHDAVSGLGLTRYTVEDMNDLVNHLATFVGLDFEDLPEEKGWGGAIGMDSMSSSMSMFGFGGGGDKQKDFSEPIWEWPTLKDGTSSHLGHQVSSHSLPGLHQSNTMSSHSGVDKHEKCTYNLVPRQVLIEVMVAQEGDIHKRIFGSKLQQFKAIKEILLAGDTNRLVAELTFVRINDLATPPEDVSLLTYLEPLVGLIIVANGIMIGFQTSLEYENWSGWVYVEIAFACILLLELLLRMRLLKCRDFWCGAERLWNWFDVFLGVMAITDVALQLVWQASSDMDGTSLLRFCRLLRLARIVKVFRLKFMRDLRLMIKGLVAGVWTLSLAFLLLAAVLYVIAGFTTVAIGRNIRLEELGLHTYFANIPMSMFTAFRCFTGECVSDEGRSIPSILAEEFGVLFVVSYVASYMLVSMGIFNVILAVYVDITMKAAKENDAVSAEQYARESIRIARATRELLKKFAAAHHIFHETEDHHVDMSRLTLTPSATLLTDDEIHENIQITKDLFLCVIQDRGVQLLMDELELPQERARLFEVIDADGSGTLHIAELVHGLLKIRGEVNKSDLVAPLLATQSVQNLVTSLREMTQTSLEAMQNEVLRQFQELPRRIYFQSLPGLSCSCSRAQAPESGMLIRSPSLGAKGLAVKPPRQPRVLEGHEEEPTPCEPSSVA